MVIHYTVENFQKIVKMESSKPQELDRFPHLKNKESYDTQFKFNEKLELSPFLSARKTDTKPKLELTSSAIPFSTTARSPQTSSLTTTIPSFDKFKSFSSDGVKPQDVKSVESK